MIKGEITLLGGSWNQGNTFDITLLRGMLKHNDDDFYKNYLKNEIALMEDCDTDCQQKGSQMTSVARLNKILFEIIVANAAIMFLGAFFYEFRVVSVCSTPSVALIYVYIIVYTWSLLNSPYAIFCSHSMQDTTGDHKWTMRDDY